MDNIISMNNVSKSFKEKAALRDLNFSVKKGEVFGFLGPSGAGKTTTIKILTSQLIPTSGQAQVLGRDVLSPTREVFQDIGVLTDNSALYERLSVKDNLVLFADINKVPRQRIDQVLEKVGLTDAKTKEVKKLSRGMRQRLNIARAVLHSPKLLFLDEPTSALDPGNVLEIHKLLRKLNQEGTTIFLTTHNMEEADKLCHRVAFLNEGKIVELGEPQALKLKYAKDDIKVILQDKSTVYLKNNAQDGAKIQTWMSKGELLSIHTQEPNLEEIFLNLTGRAL